ncbi:benzoate/H(+) symporter BenE family transporter [Streptomyces sp. AD55]|uniref:benzoate/H(+) symporter BenE family transporter n=1 Tax=Streptomyces sp. AD55 TaxID=3242895 RepID=UPI0035283274
MPSDSAPTTPVEAAGRSAPPQRRDGEHRFERPVWPPPGPRRVAADFGALYAANGVVAAVFSMTGPAAVILAEGTRGGLSQAEIASWIFGVFFLNGLLTILACWLYRQPLAFFWTIPGTVVVGTSLNHLSWPEVVGAYVVTGVLILVLGLTGSVRRVMSWLPMPIVMAMVAGVFLTFGTDLVRAVEGQAVLAVPMVAAFLLLSAHAHVGRWMPPVLGALLVGAVAVAVAGDVRAVPGAGWLAAPVVQAPQWSSGAMLELVVPLAITVLVVQNGQGMAVLTDAGHRPPMNIATVLCGVWSLLASVVGAVSTCLTGPTNALLTASGCRARRYTSGILCGVLAVVFGLLAPGFVRMMTAMPEAFVAALGGLAMLPALRSAFTAAFGSACTFGALVSFLVTVADVQLLNVGSAFWGLLAGLAVSRLLEPADFRRATTAPPTSG